MLNVQSCFDLIEWDGPWMELRHMTPIDYRLSKEVNFVGVIVLGNYGELTEAMGTCVVPVKILGSNCDDR